jgi:hypothetical protein
MESQPTDKQIAAAVKHYEAMKRASASYYRRKHPEVKRKGAHYGKTNGFVPENVAEGGSSQGV